MVIVISSQVMGAYLLSVIVGKNKLYENFKLSKIINDYRGLIIGLRVNDFRIYSEKPIKT